MSEIIPRLWRTDAPGRWWEHVVVTEREAWLLLAGWIIGWCMSEWIHLANRRRRK